MEKSKHIFNEHVSEESGFIKNIITEIGKIVVGQEHLLKRMLIGLLANGHILIEGVPGLAKTLAVRSLADSINTDFQRIQFTPDLLPTDIIGTQVYNPDTREFSPHQGPIFSNLILADEINRAPAKVQSALLEAMQERQVTIGGTTCSLVEPFMVLATQNPIEQEGTYPLPEAQMDRFMLKVLVSYPSRDEEKFILQRMTGEPLPPITPVVDANAVIHARQTVRNIHIDQKIQDYILDLVFATREPDTYGLPSISQLIAFGASPRATIYLVLSAKANAFIEGRGYVIPEDVKFTALDVLRHRVIITYEAEAEQINTDTIITEILNHIVVP